MESVLVQDGGWGLGRGEAVGEMDCVVADFCKMSRTKFRVDPDAVQRARVGVPATFLRTYYPRICVFTYTDMGGRPHVCNCAVFLEGVTCV